MSGLLTIAEIIVRVLEMASVLTILIAITVVAVRERDWASALIAPLILLAIIFYYADPVQSLLIHFAKPLASFLVFYRRGILNHLPHLGGIHILSIQLLSIAPNYQFTPNFWPVTVLYGGTLIRVIIRRFVTNERLQRVTHSYWLFITSYLILLLIGAAVGSLSLPSMLIITGLVVFILLLGIYAPLRDLFVGFVRALYVVGLLLLMFLLSIGIGAVKVAKFIRALWRQARKLYIRYIIMPCRRFYQKIEKYLKSKIAGLIEILGGERLPEDEEPRSSTAQPSRQRTTRWFRD